MQLFAVTDLDKAIPNLNPAVSWWSDLPNHPVPGALAGKCRLVEAFETLSLDH